MGGGEYGRQRSVFRKLTVGHQHSIEHTTCITHYTFANAMLSKIGANLVWENTWVDYTANWLHKVTWTDERWQKNTNVSSSLMLGFKDVITSSLPETATGLAVWISHHVCSWPISYHVSCNDSVLCQDTRSISTRLHTLHHVARYVYDAILAKNQRPHKE